MKPNQGDYIIATYKGFTYVAVYGEPTQGEYFAISCRNHKEGMQKIKARMSRRSEQVGIWEPYDGTNWRQVTK